ncbi:PREDICTED: AF4/FMR2 family member 4-like [Ceratosolen solmsi marchali]|uniref:AF4/FMR2 family member 4-like n=1 Tax=Ceratosolen solmsi marchali TaxID=326594 RepID=A0AAJ6YNZ3_9HYME|nr:PREDICTED: AF4/FMR2 family member 4-like [Ceratosolen solmsi marchali]
MPSSAGYYDDRNPLLKGTLSSVDRDRLRERERQARVAMSVQAEQAAGRGASDTRHGHHHHGHHNHGQSRHGRSRPCSSQGKSLANCIVEDRGMEHGANADRVTRIHGRSTNASRPHYVPQVNPDAHDRTTQQIQSKLGNYSLVKHLLDEPKRLIGIEGVPASPAPVSSGHPRLPSSRGSPSSAQEFKKPGASVTGAPIPAPSVTSSQRGGFIKPADGKPPYGGRGGYPGQPVKHGGSSGEHRSHGLIPAKGPPTPTPVGPPPAPGIQNRLHTASVRLPKLPIDAGSSSRHLSADSTAEVETILKEMTMPPTPLTAIAQTPRKELESKFTFNPVLAKTDDYYDDTLSSWRNSASQADKDLSRLSGTQTECAICRGTCEPIYCDMTPESPNISIKNNEELKNGK